jgi:heme/copper-type cytochrome/quinol oxidase subunit 2
MRSLFALLLIPSLYTFGDTQPRTIEIVADKDSRYKIEGKANPTLYLHSGEQVRLVITANKAKNMNRDGSVHGFVLLRAKDEVKVPGWDLMLKPGVHEFVLQAPKEPGEYRVVCTVICSSSHEDMNMKVVVSD